MVYQLKKRRKFDQNFIFRFIIIIIQFDSNTLNFLNNSNFILFQYFLKLRNFQHQTNLFRFDLIQLNF